MSNINDTYFDGHYKDIWRTLIPEELTIKEIDFITTYFALPPGSRVADLMCGYGRHAIALARKGMSVTAVDNLGDYTSEITETAEKEQLPLKVVQADIIDYAYPDQYDLVLCMGNSLNFFNAADLGKLLANLSKHIKPGGHLLINTWSIAEIAINSFKPKSWGPVGELKFLTDSRFLFQPTRIETESIVIGPDGKTETKTGIDYIYSLNEMEQLLSTSGFSIKDVFSIPGKKKFTLGEPRAYIISVKN